MKKLLLAASTTLLIGCGEFHQVIETEPTPAPPAVPTTPVVITPSLQSLIDPIVAEENEFRNQLGQTLITKGLTCSVQQISSGSRISSSSNPALGAVIVLTGTQFTFTGSGVFNQPESSGGSQNNVLPSAIRPLFVNNNYLIRCQGQIVVTETGHYPFELTSDDGSILTVDSATVINNDGSHGMTLRTGTKFLRKGVRQFRLEYAQTGGGQFGLRLTSGGTILDSSLFYR